MHISTKPAPSRPRLISSTAALPAYDPTAEPTAEKHAASAMACFTFAFSTSSPAGSESAKHASIKADMSNGALSSVRPTELATSIMIGGTLNW